MEIKDIKISAFQNMFSQGSPMEISLYDWLVTDRYQQRIETMRAETDADIQNKLKSALPVCIPSGIFDGNKNLIKHSGLMAIDIDAKDNPAYTPMELKAKISDIANVIYCGYSCRGKGVWGLIPIFEPTQHVAHFEALERIFLSMDIVIDKACKNVNRLRYCSYDSAPYFNDKADVFTWIWKPDAKPKNDLKSTKFESDSNVFESFNNSGDAVGLLTNHGWKVTRQKGDRVMLTRPDKSGGVSGEWSLDKRLFYSYTSSSVFDAQTGYNASQLFNILECNNDWKDAAKRLKQLNY